MNSSVPSSAGAPRRAVFARHAASLLVIREGGTGPEVLMGVRGAGHRFMPNRLVFPGGAVDPGDGLAPAATEPGPEILAQLGRRTGPRLARALAVCAARELVEETGLSLGTPPRLGGLHYLCRAVTPPESPIRFNARFLVVSADETEGVPSDSFELSNVAYRRIDDVLGSELMLVTAEVLRRAAIWLALPVGPERGEMARMVFRRRAWQADE